MLTAGRHPLTRPPGSRNALDKFDWNSVGESRFHGISLFLSDANEKIVPTEFVSFARCARGLSAR